MNAFETIILIVTVAAVVLALSAVFGPGRSLQDIGRSGSLWFDHQDDLPLDQRPSEDERDAPIPRRPLRGRPE
ncbi:MAG: hypothetical protein M3Z27_04245 [Actinomycetota bacterium]|nr:hypothetical protein [Actinomycetota bacterium]